MDDKSDPNATGQAGNDTLVPETSTDQVSVPAHAGSTRAAANSVESLKTSLLYDFNGVLLGFATLQAMDYVKELSNQDPVVVSTAGHLRTIVYAINDFVKNGNPMNLWEANHLLQVNAVCQFYYKLLSMPKVNFYTVRQRLDEKVSKESDELIEDGYYSLKKLKSCFFE